MSDYLYLIGMAVGVASTLIGIIVGWFIANHS